MKTTKSFTIVAVILAVVVSVPTALATTITVHSTADNGPGSLRQAIVQASSGDKINVVVNGTIILTSGELVVSKSLAISGPGTHGIISGNNISRVFRITPGTTVILDSLAITNGAASSDLADFPNNAGGGIYADHAKLTISNCAISNNSARYGGAVFSNVEGNGNGSLAVSNTTISGNAARFGAGVYNDAEAGNTTATLMNVTFKSNRADFGGGGLYNDGELNGNAAAILANCEFNGNSAVDLGGGIENDAEGGRATLSMKNCRISANSAAVSYPLTAFFFGGGGIFNDGFAGNASALLENTSITDNQSSVRSSKGAGILNHGFQGNAACVMKNCQVSGNGNGFADAAVTNYAPGGTAMLELTNCGISRNTTTGIHNVGVDESLGAVAPGTANVMLANTIINGNSSTDSESGGVFNDAGGRLNANNTTISNNSAPSGGAMVNQDADATLTNCTVNGNSGSGDVGGIANVSVNKAANLAINNCRISSNTSYTFCGGVLNESSFDPGTSPGAATLTINNSTISGNTTQLDTGGAILNGAGYAAANTTLNNCTISGNSASFGGGISNGGAEGSGAQATVTLNNTTLSGNSATQAGGAVWEEGNGCNPVAVLNNCTLSGNNAPSGGGIAVEGDPNDGFNANPVVEIANTILNRGNAGANLLVINTGALISNGYNLSSDGAGGDNSTGHGGLLKGPGDIRNTNPMLGPLQNNGGPTTTNALLRNSPAIDAGDPNFNPYLFNPPMLYDQRGPGFPRIVKGRVDIGSFEAGPH